MVSMHSVVMQSPAPLPQKKQLSGLDARAVEAAMKHVLAARGSELESQKKFTRQASSRRLSAEREGSLGSRYMFSPTADIGSYRQKHAHLLSRSNV